jgi:peptidoglycan/xylan/chitin deacetylase (PgdA/CDA1 family)
MKKAVLRLMRSSGLFASFREANKRKVLILTYHRFAQDGDDRSISAAAFEEQLHYLTEHYVLTPLSQIQNSLVNGVALPERTATITIDDGFSDTYEIAFPLLRKYSAPAALFVITGFVDRRMWLWTDKLRYITSRVAAGRTTIKLNGHELTFDLADVPSRLKAADAVNSVLKKLSSEAKEAALDEIATRLEVKVPPLPPPEYGPVSWEQLLEMERSGVEIGSHTVTHPILPNADNEQLQRELTDSRSRLESMLGHPVTLFCYPNGSYDARTREAVAQAGYKCAVTTKPILADITSDPLALSRVPAEPDMDHFVQTTCGFEQLKTALRSSG